MAYVDKDLLWADIVKNGNCHVTSGGSLPYWISSNCGVVNGVCGKVRYVNCALLWINPHLVSYLSRWLCKTGRLNSGLWSFLKGQYTLGSFINFFVVN
jgi:hypothetical protein